MTDHDAPDPAASLVSSLAHDPGRTMYGPALFGTMRVDDPADVAALRALRAPDLPRPAPRPAPPLPPPAGVPPIAVAGAALALPLPPLGLVLSAIALRRILRASPRPPGETLAVFAITAAWLTMTAVLALALG